jgi:hypothetical protein
VEGVYVRIDEGRQCVERGKVVRPDFIQGIEEDGHWMSKSVVRNERRGF